MTLSLAWQNMKSWIVWKWSFGVVVAALVLAGSSPQEAVSQATNTVPALPPDPTAEAAAPAMTDEEAAAEVQTEEAALAEASVKPISTGKPLPASLKPTGPLAEVVKLIDSGVDESVILAYVTNATSRFNLGVEEILYLNDIGVSGPVVTAMMQRDQALKELSPNAEPVPAAPPPVNPPLYAPQPVASPALPAMAPVAPPPAEAAAESYPPPPAEDTGYATFYDSLAPYGAWVNVAGYGPCWQPTVVIANPAWRPYCDTGRWVDTDCGWYWMSGYSWGWAPFHYGRWFQHHRLGWCWAPDTVWGPSWVCWRYNDRHCGWAPLPPGARFQSGFGLTYHGRHVSTSFGFGLGVNSFAFVDVSHFRDPHLNRHALPHQQTAHLYNTTAASATIVGNNNRVVNHGIPAARVAAATGTQVHQVAIREAKAPAGPGAHRERFEGNSRTLSVFQPHFPASTGAQTALSARPRSELRNGSGSSAHAPGGQRVAPDPLPPTGRQPTAAQPNSTGHFVRTAEHPTTGAAGPATIAPSSPRTPGTVSSNPTSKSAAPLILHGSDRAGQATRNSSVGAVNQPASPKPSVSPWRNDTSSRQSVSPSPAPATGTSWPGSTPRTSEQPTRSERQRPTTATSYPASPETRRSLPAPTTDSSRSRITTSSHDFLSRPTTSPRPQPMISPTGQSRPPSASAWSTPHAVAPTVRSEAPRAFTAPSYQAPAAVSRPAPMPVPTPSPRPSFSAPAASPAPQAPAMGSRPSYSPPAASAPAFRSQSGSDRHGR